MNHDQPRRNLRKRQSERNVWKLHDALQLRERITAARLERSVRRRRFSGTRLLSYKVAPRNLSSQEPPQALGRDGNDSSSAILYDARFNSTCAIRSQTLACIFASAQRCGVAQGGWMMDDCLQRGAFRSERSCPAIHAPPPAASSSFSDHVHLQGSRASGHL